MYTVVVCDTEPIAIEGLRSLLESAEDLSLVAAVSSLASALDAVRELGPSLILLDRALGLQALLGWLSQLRKEAHHPSVIVWGAVITEAEALRYLRAGVQGVVRKTSGLDSVLNCIRAVALDGTWTDQSLTPEQDRAPRPGHLPLTSRELQVMELVERGMKNKDIAVALGIRTGTVKIHLKHVFEKTGIRGRYGLALSGLREKGLLAMTM